MINTISNKLNSTVGQNAVHSQQSFGRIESKRRIALTKTVCPSHFGHAGRVGEERTDDWRANKIDSDLERR